jgi:hypothetical protein
MPDVLSIGLGGGSRVRSTEGATTVGPDSVGFRLTSEALVFGGSTLTATDIAVASGRAQIGDAERVSSLDRPLGRLGAAEHADPARRRHRSHEDVCERHSCRARGRGQHPRAPRHSAARRASSCRSKLASRMRSAPRLRKSVARWTRSTRTKSSVATAPSRKPSGSPASGRWRRARSRTMCASSTWRSCRCSTCLAARCASRSRRWQSRRARGS